MSFASKMSVITLSILLFPAWSIGARAQSNSVKCHVYVIDSLRAQRALESYRPTGDDEKDAQQMSLGVTVFPEFSPPLNEEDLTTKHYQFPGSRMFLTASIFTTDERMGSWGTGDIEINPNSVSLGIIMGDRKYPDAFSPQRYPSAQTEITLDEYTNHVRVKTWVTVKKRQYLIGLECDFMANKRQEVEKPKP